MFAALLLFALFLLPCFSSPAFLTHCWKPVSLRDWLCLLLHCHTKGPALYLLYLHFLLLKTFSIKGLTVCTAALLHSFTTGLLFFLLHCCTELALSFHCLWLCLDWWLAYALSQWMFSLRVSVLGMCVCATMRSTAQTSLSVSLTIYG